jgi:hypothetical protein
MTRRPFPFLAGTRSGYGRGYDRTYSWAYEEPEPPQPPALGGLIPVVWDGLWLNSGDQDDGLCSAVTNVEGWLDSPQVNGNDVQRVISDGAAWGPKVLQARTITITGMATGPRVLLGRLRDELARRAASRDPAELLIGDYDLERVLTADVRAGTEGYRQTPLGSSGFRWQVTLTAADPILYAGRWETAILTNLGDGSSGREYPREFPWRYALPYLPNSALLGNRGNHEAPVYARYEGPLAESTLTAVGNGIIRVAALDAGMQILVHTATLAAEAPGGLSRASYLLPGCRPMAVPAGASQRWALRSVGQGSVTLGWRSAWV